MSAPKPPRAPRTPEQATDLLERAAQLFALIAKINADREAAIAATNAVADTLRVPVVAELDAIGVVIEAWWTKGGHSLLKGKRKSIELGGCKVGTKAAPRALTYGNSDDFEVAVARLLEHPWAKPYVRTTHAVAKKDTTAALLDPKHRHAAQLRELGFGTRGGADVFMLEPVKQSGTVEAR